MGENELHRRIEGEQQRFIFHDQLVAALGIFFLCLGRFGGVDFAPLFIDGEIAVVYFFRKRLYIHIVEQRIVFRLTNEIGIFFLKPSGEFPFHSVSVSIVFPVIAYPVDEKQTQHLDSEVMQLQFPFQMLLNGLADLQTLDGIIVRAAQYLIDAKRLRLVQEQDVFIFFLAADIVDLIPVVDTAFAGLLPKRVTRLDSNCFPGDLSLRQGVQFDDSGNYDLFNQFLFIGIH